MVHRSITTHLHCFLAHPSCHNSTKVSLFLPGDQDQDDADDDNNYDDDEYHNYYNVNDDAGTCRPP